MAKQKLVKFNVKNLKYSIPAAGVYPAPADIAYATSVSLEADYNETKFYGDGEVIGILGDDKGKTGAIGVVNIENAYEIACGRALLLADGELADIQQRSTVQHAVYFAVDAVLDGETITVKNWLFGCITGKASESYAQTEDDPTINAYEYPLTVLGVNLEAALSTDDYVDAKGNTVKVFRMISVPGDTNYDTFGDTVPTPKAA